MERELLGKFLDRQLAIRFWEGFVQNMRPIETAVARELGKLPKGDLGRGRWDSVEAAARRATDKYLRSEISNRAGLTLIVCLDEAGNLGPRRGARCSFDLLAEVHRASRLAGEGQGAVLVMMDTLCSVKSFGAGTEVFTDLLTRDLGRRPAGAIEEAVQLRHLVGYGRPLWQAIAEADPHAVELILDIAVGKIAGRAQGAARLEVSRRNEDEDLLVALLAIRVPMQIVACSELAQRLVSSRLAILDDVDKEGSLYVSYMSEPVLALAAAKVLSVESNYVLALERLCLSVRQRSVLPGLREEMLTQVLTLRAYDRLVFKAGEYRPRTVRVGRFLKKLLGAEDFGKLEQLGLVTEANRGVMRGFVHLTHYVQLHHRDPPTRADLREYLARGAGLVCRAGQEGYDLVIPVLLEEKVSEGSPCLTKMGAAPNKPRAYATRPEPSAIRSLGERAVTLRDRSIVRELEGTPVPTKGFLEERKGAGHADCDNS